MVYSPSDPRYQESLKAEDEFQRLMRMSAANGIIIVCSAGNYGASKPPLIFTGAVFPARYSRPDNEIIVVGGATAEGRLWPQSTQRGLLKKRPGDGATVIILDPNDPGLAADELVGNVDIYAVASPVDAPVVGDTIKKISGTSFAAPQVVSLDPRT